MGVNTELTHWWLEDEPLEFSPDELELIKDALRDAILVWEGERGLALMALLKRLTPMGI